MPIEATMLSWQGIEGECWWAVGVVDCMIGGKGDGSSGRIATGTSTIPYSLFPFGKKDPYSDVLLHACTKKGREGENISKSGTIGSWFSSEILPPCPP